MACASSAPSVLPARLMSGTRLLSVVSLLDCSTSTQLCARSAEMIVRRPDSRVLVLEPRESGGHTDKNEDIKLEIRMLREWTVVRAWLL